MPSWNRLVAECDALPHDSARTDWLQSEQRAALTDISSKRGGANVVFYSSAFLQKPGAPPWNIQITPEDLNLAFRGFSCGLSDGRHEPGHVVRNFA